MKKALKVTFGTMLAASLVSPAFAHEHALYGHTAVWGAVTYTQPTNNGLSVGDLMISSGGGLDGGRRAVFLDPDAEWDYALGLSYHLPGRHTRLFISYDHFDDDADTGNINLRNLGLEPPPDTSGYATLDINAQELRLGAVQSLHFGDRFGFDIAAFLEYDKVRQTVTERQQQVDEEADVLLTYGRETEQKFRGFGPGMGFNARWYFCPSWNAFAGMNNALLYGNNNYRQYMAEDALDFYLYEPEDTNSLVHKLDVFFGVNYHCGFRREMCGTAFDVALGLKYTNMINVFKNGNVAFNPLSDPFSGGDNDGWPASFGSRDDWGRWGPFLKFKFGGSHA